MMRFILSLLALFALAAPSYAADTTPQKPALVKGSKSYQVRYTKPIETPETIEPAAGVETQTKITKEPSKNMEDTPKSVKVMKLHGKK